MSNRRWSDTDRELVERAWRSTSAVRLYGIETMISDAMRAADVLDALTAAGWRPLRNVVGYQVLGLAGLVAPEAITLVYREQTYHA